MMNTDMAGATPLRSNRCNVCQSTDIKTFIELLDVPVFCNVLWKSRSQALNSPKGDLRLTFCHQCGHIFNTSFHPEKATYTQHYENSLHYSPTFQRYAENLAHRLVSSHHLYGKRLVEIGCGRGDFLRLLCRIGHNRGIGFDPSYTRDAPSMDNGLDVQFIEDHYSDKYDHYKADFIYSRQVLEHIPSPALHMLAIHKAIQCQLNAVLFIEVPNVLYTLEDFGLWDLIYEHCSYFSPQSLIQLVENSGFDVLRTDTTYKNQYLTIEFKPAGSPVKRFPIPDQNLEELSSLVDRFSDRYMRLKDQWTSIVDGLSQQNLKTVVWGAGSKGVTFLNALKISAAIECVVDISPRKQGMFTAGTGHKIVSPESLQTCSPDTVIVLNPVYIDEIRDQLSSLNLSVQLISVDSI